MNDVPHSGWCDVFASDGSSITTTIKAFNTDITVKCENLQDNDSPYLYYSFELYDGVSRIALIRITWNVSLLTLCVGYGTFQIISKICDQFGGNLKYENELTSDFGGSNNNDNDDDRSSDEFIDDVLTPTIRFVESVFGDAVNNPCVHLILYLLWII